MSEAPMVEIEDLPNESFWREMTAGLARPTPLPAVLRRTQLPTPNIAIAGSHNRFKSRTVALPGSLAADSRLGVEVIVSAAWALLLSRYLGQPSAMFAMVRGGRIFPLAAQVDSQIPLTTWLQSLTGLIERCSQHAGESFNEIIRACRLDPNAVFESFLIAAPRCDIGGLPAADLELWIRQPLDQSPRLEAIYNSDLLSDAAVGRLLAQMEKLISEMVSRPEARVGELSTVPESEAAQLVSGWNRTGVEADLDRLIHELIDEQVLRTPDRTAVVFRTCALTYRELADRAAQLAARLRHQGVGPDSVVALCVERSLEMIVAMVAVLKAGGAYLPLDPALPPERLAFMLQDSRAVVVLTQAALAKRFEGLPADVILLDGPFDVAAPPVTVAPERVRPDNLAYLMYTSGSTGTPKGVMIEHRNVANFFAGMDQVLGTAPGVWLAVTSISFDISVLELLWTLARGFTIIIQADEDKLRAEGDYSIPAQIDCHRVSHLQCTPTMAELLLRSSQALASLKHIRKLLLGGEALPPALADRLSRAITGDLHNMYGPTETTIWSTTSKISAGAPISIGRPIANTQTYILDEDRSLCPIGAIGELYIGGAGVARGYWERPPLTAERFIADKFRADPGARLYRTGDLVRYRSDGEIEFLGRNDQQVKVRGYRIELGEIEAVLGAHPAVQQAVVIASADSKLLAYVVNKPGSEVSAEELRARARSKLPEYMVPVAVVFLTAMPTTPNGKIDRKALPFEPPAAPPGQSQTVSDGTPELERTIAAIWCEALGVDTIGLHQNFFDLGATSLVLAEAGISLGESLGRNVKLTDLFTHPTVSSLAAFLGGLDEHSGASARGQQYGAARRAAMTGRVRPALVSESGALPALAPKSGALIELKPGGSRTLFLVHDGDGETLLYVNLARRMPEDLAVFGIEPRRSAGVPLAHATIEEMAAFYITQVRARQRHGPYLLGGLCTGGVIAYEMASQLVRAGERVELLALLDAANPKAAFRRGSITQLRLVRLKRALSDVRKNEFAPFRRAGLVIGTTSQRVFNTLLWEFHQRGKRWSVHARFRLLRALLRRDLSWPKFVPELSEREIYVSAEERYVPKPLSISSVVLVRARTGEGNDTPCRDIYAHETFGWDAVARHLTIVDVEGGHSTMLQERFVGSLAKALIPYLQRGVSSVPARRPGLLGTDDDKGAPYRKTAVAAGTGASIR